MLAAVAAGVVLLQRGGALDTGDADALVVLELGEGVPVDSIRQSIVAEAESSWDARQVGESAGEDDDEVTLRMSLAGSNLAAAIAWLRRPLNTQAVDETVDYSVDPDQLELTPLASSEQDARPEPVLLEVRLIGDDAGPTTAAKVGVLLLLLATLSAGLLAWWWFRTERE